MSHGLGENKSSWNLEFGSFLLGGLLLTGHYPLVRHNFVQFIVSTLRRIIYLECAPSVYGQFTSLPNPQSCSIEE